MVAMGQGTQIPEFGMRLLIHLRWVKAMRELEDLIEESGCELVTEEYSNLFNEACVELDAADMLDRYRMDCGAIAFNSYFNDRAMYNFLGLLYVSRLFKVPRNRKAFLRETGNLVTEEELMQVVREGDLSKTQGCVPSAIAAYLKKILESEYFTNLPERHAVKNECLSPVLKLLRSRQAAFRGMEDNEHVRRLISDFGELEHEIVNLYKLGDWGPRRHLSIFERCSDEEAFSLSVNEAGRLMDTSRRNGFFYDLISNKPPRCGHISHEMALLECAEHARLWLLNAKLPVYYNFELRYCDIFKGASPTSVEMEAWRSPVGYAAVLLSAEEKRLRRATLASYWDAGPAATYNLAPEDFVNVKDINPEVDIIKFIGEPVELEGSNTLETCVFEVTRDAKLRLRIIRSCDLPEKYTALEEMARRRTASPKEFKKMKSRRRSQSVEDSQACEKRSAMSLDGRNRKRVMSTTGAADSGWGAKAQEVLGQVKGRGFRHEKTKKSIDMESSSRMTATN